MVCGPWRSSLRHGRRFLSIDCEDWSMYEGWYMNGIIIFYMSFIEQARRERSP
jgi:hypothetical protein